jgi:hypothetical protein
MEKRKIRVSFNRIVFLIVSVFGPLVGISQSKIDSLLVDFLTKNHSIDSIVFKKTQKGNKVIVESNFFKEKMLSKPLGETSKIEVFIFGSNSEHGDRFMLVTILNGEVLRYQFFGNSGFDNDLEGLSVFFRSNNREGLTDEYKKSVLRALLTVY